MKTLRLPLLLVLATTLLTACDNHKNQELPTPKTPTEQLVGKDWKLTARTMSPALRLADGRLITDAYAEMPGYDRDDLLRFEKPDVYTYDEGPTKRTTDMPQRYTGTWQFSNGDKVLSTKASGLGESSYDVLEVSETTLKVSGVKVESDGISHTSTFVFTKQ